MTIYCKHPSKHYCCLVTSNFWRTFAGSNYTISKTILDINDHYTAPPFGDFKNRLAKNYRHIGKWAKRQGITCFRVYDDDMPQFPLAIDVYGDCLHVAEYKRKHTLNPEQYADWWRGCQRVCLDFFALPPEKLFVKWRDRQAGIAQYEKFDQRQAIFTVSENGLLFEVNLSDYLDTGLFLDHRPTRQWVRKAAEGLHVLNLFAYTGAFSVYAAAGNAATVTSIDLSNTYLQWAQRNMALNQYTDPNRYRYVQVDVLRWLRESPAIPNYDLIVLDPPTFSNSKRMDDILEVQRDHVRLINQCLRRLRRGGILYFSTNCRSFRLSIADIDVAADQIRDVTRQSIPEDFRNKSIHYCFKIDA